MKRSDIIIFFSLVFSVYGLINFYIFFRAWSAFALLPQARIWIMLIGILLVIAYPVGRILERATLSILSEVLVYVGAIWLGEMVYLLLLTLAVDFLRVANFFIPFFPKFVTNNYSETSFVTALSIFGISSLITIFGFLNARFPRIKKLEFVVPKKKSTFNKLHIAAVSDIHLGTIMGPKRLQYIINKINSLNADIVLLVGDVFDEDIGRVIKNNLGEMLRGMKSTYGTFAITGNHEYFGGVEHAVHYLREQGIAVLRDEAISLADAITIVGREDISFNRWSGLKRKSLHELLRTDEKNLPTIVMDHQPLNLQELAKAEIDVQLSGHTHHGQLWPFNFITKKIYDVSWGYKKKGNAHIYVSCGAGSWGPPIRTGNTPEILSLTLRFQ